ncbi:MAG: hypothetical protein VX519_02250 [Myxococcota bacterium]|nr:hypothetical protein [Myxococcota bacterium]
MRKPNLDLDTSQNWTLTDWVLAVGSGCLLLVASETWLADRYMSGPSTSADFQDYCWGILSSLESDSELWPAKRSRFAALPALFLAEPLGILGALRRAAQLATVLVGFGLFGWARLLAGRTAGLSAIGIALALAPMCLLPKMLSFYPFMTAVLVLGGLMTTRGLLSSSPKGLLWVGTACALALCVDVRGLVWAVPWGLAGIWRASTSQKPKLALTCLLIPIVLSAPIGRWAYPEHALSLESQMDARPLFYKAGSTDPTHAPPYEYGGEFVWGRSTPLEWPATVAFVTQQANLEPPADFPPKNTRFIVDNRVRPLIPIWIGSALFALIALGRPRGPALALVASVAPFALAFRGQLELAEIFLRFQAQLLPGLCILLGVCIGATLERLPLPKRLSWAQAPAVLILLMLLVSGVGSTPLSQHANWRRPWSPIDHLVRFHPDTPAVDLSEAESRCTQAMADDQREGKWVPLSSARRTR